jgi:hypothetical protein
MINSRLNDMCRIMPYCQAFCGVVLKASHYGEAFCWYRWKSWNIIFHAIRMRGRTIWATLQQHVLQNGLPTCEVITHLHNIDELLTGLWRWICVCRLWCQKLQHGNWLAIIFIRLRMLTTCRYVNLLTGPTNHTKNCYNLWKSSGTKINRWRQMSRSTEW